MKGFLMISFQPTGSRPTFGNSDPVSGGGFSKSTDWPVDSPEHELLKENEALNKDVFERACEAPFGGNPDAAYKHPAVKHAVHRLKLGEDPITVHRDFVHEFGQFRKND